MSWRDQLPSTIALLCEGGDERLALCAVKGSNKYGCRPQPDPLCAEFGSSTATSISSHAFEAAEAMRRQLLASPSRTSAAKAYAQAMDDVRNKLLNWCGLQDIKGLATLFAASGTDLHLIASQLMSQGTSQPPLVIMMDGCETGSGVANAVAGHHFAQQSAGGRRHQIGVPLNSGHVGAHTVQVVQLPIRQADGQPRPQDEIERHIAHLVDGAALNQRKVLLIGLDISKTGLQVPSQAFMQELRQRWPRHVHILVDACQFRLSNASLRNHLDSGFMVAMTGSKFLTGPSFCGALLIPAHHAIRLSKQPLPEGLRQYCAQAEWPTGWRASPQLPARANFGLLLRWTACLSELHAFRQLPDAHIRHFLKVFATCIQRRLAHSDAFELLPAPELVRPIPGEWDSWQTIYPFVLWRTTPDGQRIPLSPAQTHEVYQLLQSGLQNSTACATQGTDLDLPPLRGQLGQPVSCGHRQGAPVTALRLCVSSRLIVEAVSHRGGQAEAVIQRALTLLDRTEALIQTLYPSTNKEPHHAPSLP